jgi:hypothetical protein
VPLIIVTPPPVGLTPFGQPADQRADQVEARVAPAADDGEEEGTGGKRGIVGQHGGNSTIIVAFSRRNRLGFSGDFSEHTVSKFCSEPSTCFLSVMRRQMYGVDLPHIYARLTLLCHGGSHRGAHAQLPRSRPSPIFD